MARDLHRLYRGGKTVQLNCADSDGNSVPGGNGISDHDGDILKSRITLSRQDDG
jgi:hypothetical protein